MRRVRMCLLSTLVAIPLGWSAHLGVERHTDALNQVLVTLLVGVLPLLGAMLLWTEDLRGADVDVRYGRDRRAFATRNLGASLGALLVMALLFSWTAIVAIRGPKDALLLRDLLATTAVAIPGALALGAFLGVGRVWMGKVGLLIALLLVWALGPVDAIIAALVPTGHLRSLIGAGKELPLPGWGSLFVLWTMAGAFSAATMVRVPR